MFELLVTESFAKELSKLEVQARDRIKKKLKAASQEPMLFFERLKGSELFKLRVGKFRLIAQINLANRQITLLAVGHRKNIYDKH